MSLCASCGLQLSGDASLCQHHQWANEGWAAANRLLCNLIHRGETPPRLPKADRDAVEVETWAYPADVA